MRTRRTRSAALFIMQLAGAMLVGAGCASGSSIADARAMDAPPPSTPLSEHTGILRGDIVGLGGETLGWRLESGEREDALELDVAAVLSQARSLAGCKVTAGGVLTTCDWPERGPTPVLLVRRLQRVR